MNMERRTITVKEVAQYLGVHTDLIYKLVRENKIPHFRMHTKILFIKESVDNWIVEQGNRIK